MDAGGRHFYFLVCVWGREYLDHFADYCLASLLSPGNIPALRSKERSKFLICTTDSDWQLLERHPLFEQLKAHIEPIHVPLDLKVHDPKRIGTMFTMSAGHRMLSNAAHKSGACGVFVYPEMLAADGLVAQLQRYPERFKLVLALSTRFAHEGLLQELHENGFAHPGQPLTIGARDLVRLALRNMHSETQRCNWQASYDDAGCSAVYWTIKRGQAVQFHTWSWAPLLIDYSSIAEHDTSSFDYTTLDGDYIHKNFKNRDQIYIATTSDELMVVGFTEETKLRADDLRPPPLSINAEYRGPVSRRIAKIRTMREYVYESGAIDATKLRDFATPIRVFSDPVAPWRWWLANQEFALVRRMASHPAGRTEQLLYGILGIRNLFVRGLFGRAALESLSPLAPFLWALLPLAEIAAALSRVALLGRHYSSAILSRIRLKVLRLVR